MVIGCVQVENEMVGIVFFSFGKNKIRKKGNPLSDCNIAIRVTKKCLKVFEIINFAYIVIHI